MWSFCLSSWRAGLRSRSIQAILILGLALVGVAFLAASFSPRQPKTVALDVGFSGLRFSLVLLALFWVQELVGREIERRTVLFSLAYPVPRSEYILGKFLGITGLLAIASLFLGALLWGTVPLAGPADYQQRYSVALGAPFWLTLFGLWLDSVVVAAFALWIATLSTVNLLPLMLGTLFAIGGKSLGAVLDYMARGADGQEDMLARYNPLLDAIQWVVPDLSRLDWRVGAMYGIPVDGVILAIIMAAMYIGLMLAAAVLFFSRRDFN